MLHAADDPWVPVVAHLGLARQAQRWQCSWLDTLIAARGGHNGFHSRDHIEHLKGGSTVSWADQQTRAWLKERLKDQFTGSRFGFGRPASSADAHDLRRT
jgi:predicted alpha/beta-fold hydrolase